MASTSQRTSASAPFDRPTADIILCSSDNIEFRVLSQILIAASPIFENMLADAQPDSTNASGSNSATKLPVIPLTENGSTLDTLLRIVYPIEKPNKTRTLTDIPPILSAALKYMMEWPISVLTKELLAFAPDRPLQVWAIGCELGIEEVARAGADRARRFKALGTYNFLREFVPIEEFVRDARHHLSVPHLGPN